MAVYSEDIFDEMIFKWPDANYTTMRFGKLRLMYQEVDRRGRIIGGLRPFKGRVAEEAETLSADDYED